jgi:hypothetical protein
VTSTLNDRCSYTVSPASIGILYQKATYGKNPEHLMTSVRLTDTRTFLLSYRSWAIDRASYIIYRMGDGMQPSCANSAITSTRLQTSGISWTNLVNPIPGVLELSLWI